MKQMKGDYAMKTKVRYYNNYLGALLLLLSMACASCSEDNIGTDMPENKTIPMRVQNPLIRDMLH